MSPAYYTNPTGGGEIYQQYLPAACDAAGIDFYFSGNDHSYARTAPLTAGQVEEKGTVYYICGSTGGSPTPSWIIRTSTSKRPRSTSRASMSTSPPTASRLPLQRIMWQRTEVRPCWISTVKEDPAVRE